MWSWIRQWLQFIFDKTCRDAEFRPQIVGHLSLEISWFAKFLLDCGDTITATLRSTHCRRSPLVQRGLEIPCVVNAKLIGTKKNISVQSIWKWFKLIMQNRHLMKMLSWVLSYVCYNEDVNTANRKDYTKCPNKGRKTNHWKM